MTDAALTQDEIVEVIDAAEIKANEILAMLSADSCSVISISALMMSMEAVINSIDDAENIKAIKNGLIYWAVTLKDTVHPKHLH